jgi:hypothetical protein
MTGSKQVVHWTRETWRERSEIAGSPQGSPPAANYFGCEAGRRTCSKRETGTEELCEIKSAYTLSARSLVKHPLKGDEAAGLLIVGAEPSEAPTEG